MTQNDYLNTVINADVIEGLRQYPDGVAHTCVTSPPYYGLRDYGTGSWEGGDAECDHKEKNLRNDQDEKWQGMNSTKGFQYRDECAKCGAVRIDSQIGLEQTPQEYVARMVDVFREVRRVLRDDGTVWLNVGDSYTTSQVGGDSGIHAFGRDPKAEQIKRFGNEVRKIHTGTKPKDLLGIPWMLAFALRDDGWYLRQDIIWHKPNPMPESVTDRCTKAHEYVFLLAKSNTYYYDHESVSEKSVTYGSDKRSGAGNIRYEGNRTIDLSWSNGQESLVTINPNRNRRSVWSVNTKPYTGAHFAVFPEDLIAPCILAGSPSDGVVLDPFMGSGTTAYVAKKLGRNYIGTELNPEYMKLQQERINSIPESLF